MKHLKIIIPKDMVYHTINEFGYQNILHFIEESPEMNRPFSQSLRRCEDNLARIDILTSALKKENLAFDEFD
jgi:hypothetical protein